MSDHITVQEFSEKLKSKFSRYVDDRLDFAVGVSGGADSLSLLWLLSQWSAQCDDAPAIHALIVDHALRAESAAEAQQVAAQVKQWPNVNANILAWNSPAQARVQEEARRARYLLMEEYCVENDVASLFLGHHQDDQAETLLFRLAKGSGLDGLAGMKPAQARGSIMLLRPFLDTAKVRLRATCRANDIAFFEDPSNTSSTYARVRLRQSARVLEEEGLSAKRLAVTASRLARARAALDEITENVFNEAASVLNTNRIVFNYSGLSSQPLEISIRVVLRCFARLLPDVDYAPRMERVEALCDDLMAPGPFRKRTLGGLVFERDDKAGVVNVQIEQSS